MQVTEQAAKARLSELIEAALAGEEVVISHGTQAAVRLTPVSRPTFRIGLLKDKVSGNGPDFFAPLDDDELSAWEGGRGNAA